MDIDSAGTKIENLSETVRIARDLIRIDTTNRGGGDAEPEAPAAAYVEEFLKSLGIESVTIESAPGRANLVARVEGREPDLPALVLHGHLDVVPADPTEWSVDPFAGVIKDGMLWGRGAVDMKNMDAMILTAIADILRAGKKPRRTIILAFFADEEAGGVFGAHYMVKNHPELFAGATTAISEVGGYSVHFGDERAYVVQSGEKALDWITLTAKGTAQHGSGIAVNNPVAVLATAVSKLAAKKWPVVLCNTTEALLEKIREITGEENLDPEQLLALAGNGAGFLKSSIRATTNPTVFKAGYKDNVIPGTAYAAIDVRTIPSDRENVFNEIREIVGDDIEIGFTFSGKGLEFPFSGELVDVMVESLKEEDPGAHVLPYLLSGGTDNKALSELGIAGYGFAPLKLPPELDFPGMFHGVDERVPLEALDFGKRVLMRLLDRY